MKIIALTLAFALPAHAIDPTPLAFSARIQSETLAEEAIDLLHCLADRLELPWELAEGANAPHSLKLEEKSGRLEGHFQAPTGKKNIQLGKGEANKICGELAEAGESAPAPELPGEMQEPAKTKPQWLWIGAGVALLAGGFFLWQSRPNHRAFKME